MRSRPMNISHLLQVFTRNGNNKSKNNNNRNNKSKNNNNRNNKNKNNRNNNNSNNGSISMLLAGTRTTSPVNSCSA